MDDMLRICAAIVLITMTLPASAHDPAALEDSLRATETAFAATMADRDLEAFSSFLAEDAIFSSPRNLLRGREAIVEGWRPFFDGPDAPFSWKPARVHVLDDGTIGGTTGPVFNPAGETVGHFVSTWKRQSDGTWKIILDLSPGD